MKVPDIIIAVDGWSSTGKSSFAKMVAAEFGFTYLDSGALYRAVTLFAQEGGLISKIGIVSKRLPEELKGLNLRFYKGGTYIGDRCVDKEIRTMEVSNQVSIISALAYVREYVDDILHKAGSKGRAIMDGRDIGVAVFPDAQLKIFMTASPKVRAQRRYDELAVSGNVPPMEDVVKNIQERDYLDSHREVSPLRRAEDAFELDNSDMTLEQELAWIKGLIMGKFGILR